MTGRRRVAGENRITDFLARLFIGVLFMFLTANLVGDFLRTGRVTGLLLVASEGLVVVLTIVRRQARLVDSPDPLGDQQDRRRQHPRPDSGDQ